ncbi:serine hydrolase domain-containing protein [Streptomyces sp. NPDC089922]|uniref:serine hydrolase domain-containing protein n=1 Tax=Streptomyces sp. NPDC089922 TaxID=3155189 RepID=UPI00344004BC
MTRDVSCPDIEAERARHGIPGMAVAVVNADGLVHSRGFGRTSSREDADEVTPETVFRLGSVTKPLTATTLLRLHDRGAVDLDRPVADVLPALLGTGYPSVGRITPRMLLGHTAGLPHDFFPTGGGDPADLPDAVLRSLRAYGPVAPPGTAYSYSNPGYDLAGALAATAAGTPFPELVAELVLRPLGMTSTTFDPGVAAALPLASGHRIDAAGKAVEEGTADNVAHYPSGFALSTAVDMGRFAAEQLDGGAGRRDRLLSVRSRHLAHAAHASLFLPDGSASTLGFHRWQWQGRTVIGHAGDICGYGAWLGLFPEDGVGAVLLANAIPPGFDGRSLLHRILRAHSSGAGPRRRPPVGGPPGTGRPAPADPGALVGVYVGQATGLVRLTAEGPDLTAEINGRRVALRATDDGRFEGEGPEEGSVVSLGFPDTATVPTAPAAPAAPAARLMVDGELCERFDEARLTTPDPDDLARYIGTYTRVDEVSVFVRAGELFLHSQEDLREFRCTPLTRTMFAFEGGVIEFMVDESGLAGAIRARNAVTLHRTGARPYAVPAPGGGR